MSNIKKFFLTFIIAFFIFGIFTNTQIFSNDDKPKNIILFIGDGMGYNHITASNYYLYGNGNAVYEDFPVKLSMSTFPGVAEKDNTYTYNYVSELYWNDFEYAKIKPTDSGAASTAMASGIKTYRHAIGVDLDKQPAENLTEFFKNIGKTTGVISSVPFSHATPAGFVAHHPDRNEYGAIATQMLESDVDVIIGGGHPYYDNNGLKINNPNYEKFGSEDNWNKARANYKGRVFVETKEDFEKYSKGNAPEKLFGIPQVFETLQYNRDNDDIAEPFAYEYNDNVPTLETLTLVGLNALSQNNDGFFVMVEGGAIDWASHANHTGRMIEEMDDFNKSIEAAVNWVEKNSNWEETLIIVTADHECGYLTGPKDNDNSFSSNPVVSNGKNKLPNVKWCHDSHTNVLVPFFAKGSCANTFKRYAVLKDKKLGYYLDNTHIPLALFNLFEK
jgi:alkaline phosphatase